MKVTKPKTAVKPKPATKTPVKKKPVKTVKKPAVEKPLTPQQEKFCQQVVLNGGKKSEAYRVAYPKSLNWKDKTVNEAASRLSGNSKVQARIAELQAKVAEIAEKKFSVTTEYVLKTIVETVERCRQGVKPKYDRAGDQELVETPEGEGLAFVFDAGNVLKGAELLGRHLKMFTDKVEHTGKDGGSIKLLTAEVSAAEAANLYKEMLGQ